MQGNGSVLTSCEIPIFNRDFFSGHEPLTQIGQGEIGGKARGLVQIHAALGETPLYRDFPGISVEVPKLAIITTQHFDQFMAQNELLPVALSGESDERIAHHFLSADLPADLTGDLWALIARMHTPLAVRSSSLLEDSLETPFAGIYETKMIPNNEHDAESRFHRLVEAIKLIYASTYFRQARAYAEATGHDIEDEKMAVILQEVAGRRHGLRFYPDISGVARSVNHYPVSRARAEDGVVDLALGLGRTIVDGGRCWTYSPSLPRIMPPFNSTSELLKQSQTQFWAVNMGPGEKPNPLSEVEFMRRYSLQEAEYDNVLANLVSTWDAASERLTLGVSRSGPRVLTFAPILRLNTIPLNPLIKALMPICEAVADGPVEIEFAVTVEGQNRPDVRFHMLQVRRMADDHESIYLDESSLTGPDVLVRTRQVLGNGRIDDIRDIVWLDRNEFDFSQSRTAALLLEAMNRQLTAAGRPYLLLGFGRWGSSDPWLGVPVKWPQISGAKIIVEAQHPERPVDFSQGSHFFHNVANLGVLYLSVPSGDAGLIDWKWLESLSASVNGVVRHASLDSPLSAAVSMTQQWGVIKR